MKAKLIQIKELPKREGQNYSSFDVTFQYMEGQEMKLVQGLASGKANFVLNQEFDIIVEAKMSQSGKSYNSIRRADQAKPKYEKDYVSTIISTGTSYALDLFLLPPFREGKFDDVVKGIIPPMLEVYKVSLTPREKEFISFAMSYAVRVYKDDFMVNRFRQTKKLDGKDVKKELELVVMLFNHIMKNMLDINKTT